MDINRVIQIDADSSRELDGESFLTIKWAGQVSFRRSRQPNCEQDIPQDLNVLSSALITLILEGESNGSYKQGEAISMVIDGLQRMYVDAKLVFNKGNMEDEHQNLNIGRNLDGLQ